MEFNIPKQTVFAYRCSCGSKIVKSLEMSGYKLHLDVADGQVPIIAVLTGANVHVPSWPFRWPR